MLAPVEDVARASQPLPERGTYVVYTTSNAFLQRDMDHATMRSTTLNITSLTLSWKNRVGSGSIELGNFLTNCRDASIRRWNAQQDAVAVTERGAAGADENRRSD
jgi:hypothetical protein